MTNFMVNNSKADIMPDFTQFNPDYIFIAWLPF